MIYVIKKSKYLCAITFIELLIVIIIIGILVGLSVPQFRKTFDNFELESFSKDIYYLSQYLHSSAIMQSRIHCLNIAQDKKPIEFWATYKNDSGEFEKIEGRFGKIYSAPPEVQLLSQEPAHKTHIYFYPDGSIENIKITLLNQHKKEVSLIIQGASGTIKIQ